MGLESDFASLVVSIIILDGLGRSLQPDVCVVSRSRFRAVARRGGGCKGLTVLPPALGLTVLPPALGLSVPATGVGLLLQPPALLLTVPPPAVGIMVMPRVTGIMVAPFHRARRSGCILSTRGTTQGTRGVGE